MKYLFFIVIFTSCNLFHKGTAVVNRPPTKPVDTVVIKPVDTPVVKAETVLNWPDRRAIGMLMMANWLPAAVPPNYRNWFLQGTYDFADFKTAAIEHINESIKNLKYINAQGVVIWDIEGQQFPHSITYIGSPDKLNILAPEMDAIADTLFQIITEAGFKTGVCLRPTLLKNLPGWPGQFVADPYTVLKNKVVYAKKRWGCSLFYVDSNVGIEFEEGTDNTVGSGHIYSADVFKRLMIEFPDCLFIPEWTNADYDKYVAPYWHKGWGADMRNNITVIDCGDTNWWQETLNDAVKNGHILMGRVWWGAPELAMIKEAYKRNKVDQ